jgi:hypothetical protein
MSPCPAFEDRLLDYDTLPAPERHRVDAHTDGCASCRQFLAVLREVDAAFTTEVRGLRLPPQRYGVMLHQVMTAPPIARVSRLPEWMDFVAAGAVCASGCAVAWQTGLLTYVVMSIF